MKQIIKNIFMGLALASVFTSCLKDKPLMDPDKTENVVELYATSVIESSTTSPVVAYNNSFDIAPEVTFNLIVSYSGADVAPQDINVQLALAPDALKLYNDSNKTSVITLPAEMYTMASMNVTIPKGERRAIVPVKLKTNLFDFTKSYAIPLKIQSASYGTISRNFGAVIYKVGAKNEWDGTYTNTYKSTLGNGTNSATLSTRGANVVRMPLIGVYSNDVFLTIDPATKKVTVSMTTLLPIATDPVSNYNPETKTFYLKWTSNGGARTFEQTLVRK